MLVIGRGVRADMDDGLANDYVRLLDILLSAGTPADGQDIVGLTALHYAATWSGTSDLIKIFLKHKAKVNLQDRFGASPLLIAIERDFIDTIQTLLDGGADLDVTDGEGRSPRSVYPMRPAEVSGAVRTWMVRHKGKAAVLQGDRCSKCGVRSSSIKRCTRCRSQLYCSPECQSEFIRADIIYTVPSRLLRSTKERIGKNTKRTASRLTKTIISSS